jgi:hypothetical protein
VSAFIISFDYSRVQNFLERIILIVAESLKASFLLQKANSSDNGIISTPFFAPIKIFIALEAAVRMNKNCAKMCVWHFTKKLFQCLAPLEIYLVGNVNGIYRLN